MIKRRIILTVKWLFVSVYVCQWMCIFSFHVANLLLHGLKKIHTLCSSSILKDKGVQWTCICGLLNNVLNDFGRTQTDPPWFLSPAPDTCVCHGRSWGARLAPSLKHSLVLTSSVPREPLLLFLMTVCQTSPSVLICPLSPLILFVLWKRGAIELCVWLHRRY